MNTYPSPLSYHSTKNTLDKMTFDKSCPLCRSLEKTGDALWLALIREGYYRQQSARHELHKHHSHAHNHTTTVADTPSLRTENDSCVFRLSNRCCSACGSVFEAPLLQWESFHTPLQSLPAPEGFGSTHFEFPLTNFEEHLFKQLTSLASKVKEPTVPLRVAGGWVRDRLMACNDELGRPLTAEQRLKAFQSPDIDIAVEGMTGRQFVDAITPLMEGGASVKLLEASPDQSKHLEVAILTIDGCRIDVVHLRSESYTSDSRIPEVEFGTPEEDAFRRDFTINSLFFHIQKRKYEDMTRFGVHDLKNMILRTPLFAGLTFQDDPLRALRAIRFASRYSFALHPEILASVRHNDFKTALATKITRERVGSEVFGAFHAKPVETVHNLLIKMGLIEEVFWPRNFYLQHAQNNNPNSNNNNNNNNNNNTNNNNGAGECEVAVKANSSGGRKKNAPPPEDIQPLSPARVHEINSDIVRLIERQALFLCKTLYQHRHHQVAANLLALNNHTNENSETTTYGKNDDVEEEEEKDDEQTVELNNPCLHSSLCHLWDEILIHSDSLENGNAIHQTINAMMQQHKQQHQHNQLTPAIHVVDRYMHRHHRRFFQRTVDLRLESCEAYVLALIFAKANDYYLHRLSDPEKLSFAGSKSKIMLPSTESLLIHLKQPLKVIEKTARIYFAAKLFENVDVSIGNVVRANECEEKENKHIQFKNLLSNGGFPTFAGVGLSHLSGFHALPVPVDESTLFCSLQQLKRASRGKDKELLLVESDVSSDEWAAAEEELAMKQHARTTNGGAESAFDTVLFKQQQHNEQQQQQQQQQHQQCAEGHHNNNNYNNNNYSVGTRTPSEMSLRPRLTDTEDDTEEELELSFRRRLLLARLIRAAGTEWTKGLQLARALIVADVLNAYETNENVLEALHKADQFVLGLFKESPPELTVYLPSNYKNSKSNAIKAIDLAVSRFARDVQRAKLCRAHQMKPLLSGHDLQKIHPKLKGVFLGKALHELVLWQLAHAGTQAHYPDHVDQLKAEVTKFIAQRAEYY